MRHQLKTTVHAWGFRAHALTLLFARSSKAKDQFVAMVSHEARTRRRVIAACGCCLFACLVCFKWCVS